MSHVESHRDWLMRAEAYADDEYGLDLDELKADCMDCASYATGESPEYYVDELYKDYDPTPDEQGEPPITMAERQVDPR